MPKRYAATPYRDPGELARAVARTAFTLADIAEDCARGARS